MSGAGTSDTPEAVEALIARVIRPEVRALTAYHVQDAAGLVKLDAMENPYTLPQHLVEPWVDALRAVALNRYPSPDPAPLKRRLREIAEIPETSDIVLGNGSDELIQLVVAVAAGPGRTVVSVDPSFSMYALIGRALGSEFVSVPLAADEFDLDEARLLETIERRRPTVVFLAYPNNPTGNLFTIPAIEAVLRAAPGLVVVDEAYAPFAEASVMPLLPRHPNLVVLRTLSKLGLAGLRLGYLAAGRALAAEFEKLRLPYNTGVLTQAGAAFALAHYDVFLEQSARIRTDRGALLAALEALPGVRVWPSRTNFLLFRVGPGQAPAIKSGLENRGVLVKLLDGASPLLADCLRVTVGRPEENAAFIEALGELV